MRLLIAIFILVSTNYTLSNELVDILKLDNDIVLIRCTEEFDYTTSLSGDKKNLTINLVDVTNSFDESSVKLRSDLQKEIFISNNEENIKLNLLLTNSSGFNSYKLPYSNSLVVESFNWDEISKDEESYRDALFAYESMLYEEAISKLKLSNTDNYHNGIFGLIYLLQDSVALSYERLIKAARNNSYIPDVYAALSQIHLQNGDTTKAKYYNQRFIDKLNIKDSSFSYPKLIFNSSNLNLNNYSEVIDSSDVDKIETLSEEKRFSNLFDTVSRNKKSENSLNNKSVGSNTSDIKDLAIYMLIGFILLVLFVFAYYLKWRNLKLEKQKDNARNDFEKQLMNETKTSKTESMVYDRTAGIKESSTSKITKAKPTDIRNNSNFELKDIDNKIIYNKIIENIELSNSNNINLKNLEQLSNKSKSKLFRKYFVNSK